MSHLQSIVQTSSKEMYQTQVAVIICVFINILLNSDCTSCEQKICNCREDMIFCLDVAVPSFNYRLSV